MATPDENSPLLKVAQAVSDGHPVDWDSLGSSQPGAGDELSHMKAMAALAQAHRQARPSRPAAHPGPESPPRPAAAGTRLRAWLAAALAATAILILILLFRLLS